MDAVTESMLPLATPPAFLTAACDGARILQSLVREVPALRNGRMQLRSCTVEDLRLKGRQWIARYVVTRHDPSGEPRSVPLTGVLRIEGAATDDETAGEPFESAGWVVTLTDPPLTLRPARADRNLRALPVLTDPALAGAWLERSLSTAFPGIRILACRSEVARYRPGQRCTVICRLSYGDEADRSWPEVAVAKIHRSGEAAHGHGALQALAAAGVGGSGNLRFAAPLAYVAEDDVALQGNLPQDRSLIHLIGRAMTNQDAIVETEDALRAVAGALVDLHGASIRYGPVRGLGEEIASVRTSADKLAVVFPELRGSVDPFLRLVAERAAEVSADPARPSHGAFRPAQIRLCGQQVGVLDLDGFGQSEPGQDVGRFVGKLRLVALGASAGTGVDLQTRLAAADRLANVFLDAYGTGASVSPVRVTLWEGLDLAKALLQSWSRARPAQIPSVLSLLAERVVDLQR